MLSFRCAHDTDQRGLTELVHQPTALRGFLDDSFLVVLAHGAAQFVVVHHRPVLAGAPQGGHFLGVLDLEDAFLAVDPPDAVGVGGVSGHEELHEELPEVDATPISAAIGGSRARGLTFFAAGHVVEPCGDKERASRIELGYGGQYTDIQNQRRYRLMQFRIAGFNSQTFS